MAEKTEKPTYIMVPRKLIIAWLTTSSVIFIGVLASFQYANYVDRQSNQRLCGVVVLSNEVYKANPPKTVLGQKIAAAMEKLQNDYSCK